jgi:hypothetical protein
MDYLKLLWNSGNMDYVKQLESTEIIDYVKQLETEWKIDYVKNDMELREHGLCETVRKYGEHGTIGEFFYMEKG